MGFFWRSPAQALLDAIGRELAEEDVGELDRPTGEDHELKAPGEVCAYCHKVISASQPVRLAGENDWVHYDCHKPRD